MPDLDDARLDQIRFFSLYAKLAAIQLGTLVNAHDYHTVKRLVQVEEESIVAAESEDPLAEILVEGILSLPSTERDGATELSIEPGGSMAALFQDHPLARALKPKLWIAYDLQDEEPVVCGMLTSCLYERDDALSTTRLTHQYCSRHGLPRLDSNWTLIDVVASSKPGTGALLLLSAIVTAARQKRTGICSIAVTKAGRRLFASFGFETSHGWREKGGHRYLCHARISDLHLADLHRRLRVHDALITDVCFREGLTKASKDRLIGRC